MAAITVHIPDPTAAALRERAKAAGKPVEQWVTELLEAQAVSASDLRQMSGEVHKRFLESGMTEDELAERLEQEDHRARGVPYDE